MLVNFASFYTHLVTRAPWGQERRFWTKFAKIGSAKINSLKVYLLHSEKIVISREEICRKLNIIEIFKFEILLSNHEEVDTKLIAHAVEYLSVAMRKMF